MGTRGFIGFVADGIEKIGYNHNDSYPDGLGVNVLNWVIGNQHGLTCDIRRGESGGPADLIRRLRVIDSNAEPTEAEIKQFKGTYNPNVGGRSERPTWYQLLRETQGNPAAILRAGAIEDASNFPADSLFAEWGYMVDLDAQTFEVYRGFQTEPHDRGRFARRDPRDMSVGRYYPVALAASWPLDSPPTHSEFLSILERDEDEAAA